MTSDKSVVTFADVGKTFAKDGRVFTACTNLSFTVEEGEVVAIVGETGCGKSTALALMLGLQAPSRGSVRVIGVDPFADFDALKGKIGIIFQNDRLLPWRTAIENVEFGMEVLRVPNTLKLQRAKYWLNRVGLERFANSYPHQLSGGMRQRVSIARTFALNPPLLLADEAFSALDEITAASLRGDLLDLIGEEKKTTVFITHSVTEASELAQRILVFARPGRVVAQIDAGSMLAAGRSHEDVAAAIRIGMKDARAANMQLAAS